MASRVAVFGYGAVGRALTARLAAGGRAVRVVQRSDPGALPAGATFHAADATDPDQVARAAADQDAVVCALGFPYDAKVWAKAWPAAMDAALTACERTGARFVFADNLYMYGPQTAPLREDMPLTAYGRKPRIRAEITRSWQEAHAAGRVRAVAVRASDFYGPNISTSRFSDLAVGALARGKPAFVVDPLDTLHAYTYVPDFARALETLIDAPDDAYGQAWHVPNDAPRTLRQMLTAAAEALRTPLKISVIPTAFLPLVGLFNSAASELVEMQFQFDRPYLVDHAKFAARFWADPTPFAEGLARTIDGYRPA